MKSNYRSGLIFGAILTITLLLVVNYNHRLLAAAEPDLPVIKGEREFIAPFSVVISDYLQFEEDTALVYLVNGDQIELTSGNSMDYVSPDGKFKYKDLIGIWLDPPKLCVTHIVKTVLSALQTQRVLVILLDGLSYYDLVKLEPPFLATKTALPARTVMPSISPVALGSILTGKLPYETGITARGMRELKVDDIFVEMGKMEKTSAMVEGSSKVINTSIEQFLNPDLNGDGGTDDEVFACAQTQLDSGVDFVFIHFHGYDDLAHTYGPLSPEASAKMLELDTYVERLCKDFTGFVLVMADHGQHATEGNKLGDHGEFSYLDLTIPWIQWENRGE